MSSSARKIKAARLVLSLPASLLKPRNQLVAAALMRKAGKHQKTNKAQRRQANAGLNRELDV